MKRKVGKEEKIIGGDSEFTGKFSRNLVTDDVTNTET